jgi:hypothetical protein
MRRRGKAKKGGIKIRIKKVNIEPLEARVRFLN